MSDKTRAPAPSAPLRPKRIAPPTSSSNTAIGAPSMLPGSSTQRLEQGTSAISPSRNLPGLPIRQHSGESFASQALTNYSAVSEELSSRFEKSQHTSRSDKDSLNFSGTPGPVRSIPSTKSSSSSSLMSAGGDGSAVLSMKEMNSARLEQGNGAAYNEDAFGILTGEELKLVCRNVQFNCPFSDTLKSGTLSITNYRMVFRTTSATDGSSSFEVPLSNILTIEKINSPPGNRAETSFRLRIWGKDLRKITLIINKSSDIPSQKNFMEILKQYAFPHSYKRQLFAFDYKGDYKSDGWSVYDVKGEFRRQGVPNDMWRIATVNHKYELCDTYPSMIAVPNPASDDLLMNVASFRSRGRIPVMSWIHPVSHATITRSSQPLVGINGRRSKDDENYVKLIHEANPVHPGLVIMDARPNVNAMANKAKGGGYENEENYQNTEVVFLDIHNIHVMRESLRKVREMCSPKIEDPNHFYSNLETSQWLHHVKAVLAGALKIVDKVENYKSSVLVHCSDGWDRTSQLTSLSMIMLDPFYRTVRGFEVLIEKEWVSFGHKFAHRIGHGEEKQDSDRSPIFLQFIDCVWQLMQQFETAFEFNERLLIAILDNLYSCRYGTFLCNFEKEMHEKGVKSKTVSLWSFINSNLSDFRNPFYYMPTADGAPIDSVLLPLTTLRYLQLWMRYYARWDPSTKQQEPVDERYSQLLFAVQKLTEMRDSLKREVAVKKSRPPPSNSSSPSHGVVGAVHV